MPTDSHSGEFSVTGNR